MSPVAAPSERVERQVQEQHGNPEPDLQLAREPWRIDDRDQVMVDEPASVAALASAIEQLQLERRQGTHPSDHLDRATPKRGRNMKPCETIPSQHEQSAKDDERDEHEVEDDDEVGQKAVEHGEPSLPWISNARYVVAHAFRCIGGMQPNL